jgi:hypothetical protein
MSMGDHKKAVPGDLGELKTYLQKLAENQKHLKSVKVNKGRIEIDLSFAANMAGYKDSYMPLKADKVSDAKALIDRLMDGLKKGSTPTDADAQTLFEMIDQQGA